MTKNSAEMAKMISEQNKTPLEKVFENGFTGTTFAPTLPDIRDERVNCNMGAVEVWNAKEQKWEDLPFVIEDGQWKIDLAASMEAGTATGVPRDRPDVVQVGRARDIVGRPMVAAILGEDVAAAARDASDEFDDFLTRDARQRRI